MIPVGRDVTGKGFLVIFFPQDVEGNDVELGSKHSHCLNPAVAMSPPTRDPLPGRVRTPATNLALIFCPEVVESCKAN